MSSPSAQTTGSDLSVCVYFGWYNVSMGISNVSVRPLLLAYLACLSGVCLQAAQPSFEADVAPFLTAHCVDCHSHDDPKAGLVLADIKPEMKTEAQAKRWEKILLALQFDDMPPPESARPKPLAKAKIVLWIETKMAQSGHADIYRQKLLKPEYGNYVSHALLFSGQIKTPPFSPSRLWRLSPYIFKNKGIHKAQSPFSFVTSERGLRDYSATSGVDQSTIEMILINTSQFLEHREGRGEFQRFADDQEELDDEAWTQALRNEFHRAVGRWPTQKEDQKYLAFLKKNLTVAGRMASFKTTVTAMHLSSEAVYRMELGLGPVDSHGRRMLSPDELAHALAYALTDRRVEQITELREALQQKKLSTKQDVAAVVTTILDRGVTVENTPRVMRFFEEFFGYNQADKVFKDMQRVNQEGVVQWLVGRLMYEAEQLVEYWVNRDRDVIRELLTSNRFYVAHPGDNAIARKFHAEVIEADYVEKEVQKRLDDFLRAKRDPNRQQEQEELQRVRTRAERHFKRSQQALQDGITPFPGWPYGRVDGKPIRGQGDLLYIGAYNLPPSGSVDRQLWDWPIEQPFELPADQRAGLLTHPAWLAAHSVNDGNDPIRRGRWIREKLLAGVVQDVPPDVDANVPNDPHKTLRERMQPLRAETCWRCHRKMNPLGEPFEVFADWGWHRTHVYFDQEGKIVHQRGNQFDRWLKEGKLTAKAIDASGEITGSGDPQIDGKVDNAIEMMHRIGGSQRARQSFIRHLFRFFMGRNEMLSDSQTLIQAEQDYLEHGGSFKALVVSLLTSDSFLYRR